MPLRFLADHCAPNSLVEALRGAGYTVFRLKELLPVESADSALIAKAREIDAILISLNGDFANIVTYPPRAYNGILAIQLRNHPGNLPSLSSRLLSYLAAHPAAEHYRGKLFVIETNRIRIRT